jgi:hypothetical protein
MSSQILVQEQKEALPGASNGGIQIVELRIDHITLSRTGNATRANRARPFDFDVDLSEKSRTGNSLRVGYSFSFGKPASGQTCKIGGEAVVRFPESSSDRDFHYLGNDLTNEIAVAIFRKNYESIYLLHEAMAMDAPSPWITQDVSLS